MWLLLTSREGIICTSLACPPPLGYPSLPLMFLLGRFPVGLHLTQMRPTTRTSLLLPGTADSAAILPVIQAGNLGVTCVLWIYKLLLNPIASSLTLLQSPAFYLLFLCGRDVWFVQGYSAAGSLLETSSLSSSDSVLPPHPPPPDFFFASLPVLIPCKNLQTAAFNTAVGLGSNRQLNLCPQWSWSVQAAQVSAWVLRPGVGPAVLWREGCKSSTCLTNRKFLSF